MVSIGYDPESQVLEIEFSSGGVYQYLGVEPSVHAWMMRNPGKTAFVNRVIKPKYAFLKVPGPGHEQDVEALLRASLDPNAEDD